MKKITLLATLGALLLLTGCPITDYDYSFVNYQIENQLSEDVHIKFYELWVPDENSDPSLNIYRTQKDSIIGTYVDVTIPSGETFDLIKDGTTGLETPAIFMCKRAEIIRGNQSIVHRRDYGIVNFNDNQVYPLVDETTVVQQGKRRKCHTFKLVLDDQFLKNYPDNDYK